MIFLIKIRLKSMLYHIKKTFSGKRKGVSAFLVPMLALCLLGVEGMLFSTFTIMTGLLDSSYPWLYFAIIGIMAFGLGVFGTVFTTQNQMYEAKDNEMLLSMPIRPRSIIMSRILVLYLITLFFTVIVVLPAALAYFQHKSFQFSVFLFVLIGSLAMSLITQAITCFLGWLLHFILSGFRHTAIVATIFMSGVMVLYFYVINRLDTLVKSLVENGEKIASAVQSFVWPFYAFGKGCLGNITFFLLFLGFSLIIFGATFYLLSSTFSKALLSSGKKKGAVVKQWDGKTRSVLFTICRKERKFFFTSTTYLINLGMGIVMVLVVAVAGAVMREKLFETFDQMKMGSAILPFFAPILFGVFSGMTAISAPSVSLEGKYFWILRTMPVNGGSILKAKLLFHCLATIPTAVLSALILSIALHFPVVEILLTVAFAIVIYFLCGVMGLIFNMCFPRLEWPNEAAPCKQSMSLLLTMFFMFILGTVVSVIGFVIARLFPSYLYPVLLLFMLLLFLLLAVLFYLLLIHWGGRKYEEIE